MGHPSKDGQQRTEITVLEFSECSGLEKDIWESVVEDTRDLYIKGKKKIRRPKKELRKYVHLRDKLRKRN